MTHTARAPRVAVLWQPVGLLPSQLASRKNRAHSPEMRLVAAILESALRSVVRNANARRGPRRREFIETCYWLLDDGRDWPFAFANVCDLLGLEASAVRQWLLCGPSGRQVRFEQRPQLGHRTRLMKDYHAPSQQQRLWRAEPGRGA